MERFSAIQEEQEQRHRPTVKHHNMVEQPQQLEEMSSMLLVGHSGNPRTDKYNRIRQCLAHGEGNALHDGGGNDVVDDVVSPAVPAKMCLWELRELALTRGGLVNGTFLVLFCTQYSMPL